MTYYLLFLPSDNADTSVVWLYPVSPPGRCVRAVLPLVSDTDSRAPASRPATHTIASAIIYYTNEGFWWFHNHGEPSFKALLYSMLITLWSSGKGYLLRGKDSLSIIILITISWNNIVMALNSIYWRVSLQIYWCYSWSPLTMSVTRPSASCVTIVSVSRAVARWHPGVSSSAPYRVRDVEMFGKFHQTFFILV